MSKSAIFVTLFFIVFTYFCYLIQFYTKKEYFSSVENVIDSSLSDFEKKVLNRYVQGESYVKIAERLDAPVKSVDNAIQRIRKKTAKNIQAESNI
mgnify:CR=1 FL=1